MLFVNHRGEDILPLVRGGMGNLILWQRLIRKDYCLEETDLVLNKYVLNFIKLISRWRV